uniref:Glycerol kinase n=1 Tax=Panagrellus redivivus TaxID=6233 RepID=A0A7E4W691_PANRE
MAFAAMCQKKKKRVLSVSLMHSDWKPSPISIVMHCGDSARSKGVPPATFGHAIGSSEWLIGTCCLLYYLYGCHQDKHMNDSSLDEEEWNNEPKLARWVMKLQEPDVKFVYIKELYSGWKGTYLAATLASGSGITASGSVLISFTNKKDYFF